MALVLGLNAKSYIGTGTVAVPVWATPIGDMRDETLNMNTALADVTTRDAKGWRLQVGTLTEGTVDGQILYDTAHADFNTIKNAFFGKTSLMMGFFDGPVATQGTQGLVGSFMVTNFSIPRMLEEAMMVDVTFTATSDSAGNPPAWKVIP